MVVNYQGTWQSNWEVPKFEWRTECTGGVIDQLEQFGDLYYARHADPALTEVELPPHEIWVTETIGLLAAFVASVVDGQPLPCSGRDHLSSLAMLEACITSSRDGQRITVAEVLQAAGAS
jgi:predicted dehydrogenase